jgi:hypothetical protein
LIGSTILAAKVTFGSGVECRVDGKKEKNDREKAAK